jgi:protocatechuate 3,4-dioxygenase beta subunit
MRKMPHAPARAAFALLAALACGAPLAPPARAQTPAPKELPATVEGRVTDGEKGLAGVHVSLIAQEPSSRTRLVARAKTDHEGRYRMTGVPPGSYNVLPAAPVYVFPDTNNLSPGRPLLLTAGDTATDIDFRLTRGGVITGRVTDADGQPVVGEDVQLTRADKSQQPERQLFNPMQRQQTDDRGIYRIYGLAPGAYRVSVGQDAGAGAARMGGARRFYRRTFHPDATEESQARVVEVGAGAEATGVDITLGRAAKTYSVSGRFVGPDGRPVPGVIVGYGVVEREGRSFNAYGGGAATNARGEFQLDGLVPGSYGVFALPTGDGNAETYSDAVEFVVSDADVSGLEVKMRRGGSVAGVVQVEGTSDRATVARIMSRLRIAAHAEPTGSALTPPTYAHAQVAPDGSFRVGGLRPGRVRFGLGWPQTPGVTLARVELNGAAQNEGFEIAEGAQLSGVRVVVAYGSAVVRGQVNVTNGTLPPNAQLFVFARRVVPGQDPRRGDSGRGAQVDARGRFLMEGVAAGEYEITVRLLVPNTPGAPHATSRQQVFVPEGGDITLTFTLDLANP